MGLHAKYLATSRASKANWTAHNRDRINAKRRERRLRQRSARLAKRHCLNCTALLSERLDWSAGRSNLYCRKCLTEHPDEVRRDRCRRYYNRKNNIKPKRAHKSFIDRLKQLPPIPMHEEPKQPTSKDPFRKEQFTLRYKDEGRTKTPIAMCVCGNRYLKTRRGQ